MKDDENGAAIGIKWAWLIFLFLALVSVSACVARLIGVSTGYRWWWWLVVVSVAGIGGGIAGALHQERKNRALRSRRLGSLESFLAMLNEKNSEIQAGRMTIGLGCLKAMKKKTEFQPSYRVEYTVRKYEIAPLTFDTSPVAGKRKYETSKNCPLCERELKFLVKRDQVKPKVRLARKEKAGNAHTEFGWPLFLHKMKAQIRSIRVLSLLLLSLAIFLLVFSFLNLDKTVVFFVLLAVIALVILFAVHLFLSPFHFALKHLAYSDKTAEDIWQK